MGESERDRKTDAYNKKVFYDDKFLLYFLENDDGKIEGNVISVIEVSVDCLFFDVNGCGGQLSGMFNNYAGLYNMVIFMFLIILNGFSFKINN